jgi:uncharacterized protein DUF6049
VHTVGPLKQGRYRNTMSAMASSRAVRSRARRLSWLARLGVAAGVLAITAALPLTAGSAQAEPKAHSGPPLALTVIKTSQPFATPGETISITGRLVNRTDHLLSGLTVQLSSSTQPLTGLADLENFANGSLSLTQSPVSGATQAKLGKLTRGQSEVWTLQVPVKDLNLSCFGVYPLTVRAGDATGAAQASEPMPLAFWPNKASGCSTAARPKPFTASWVWPLIDSPHQGPCPGLLNNFLATSIAKGGRLSNLVNLGYTFAGAHLTWAIDPALLDNVTTMQNPYRVGNSVSCVANRMHPADKQAGKWLSSLATATAGQQVFVTPYADVDLDALAQFGNNTDLRKSFSNGEQLASRVLHRASKTAPLPAGPKQLSAIAWPADGRATRTLLENLGAMKIGTVILAMPQNSQGTFTPGAVTSTFDGVGTKLKVLLADDSLTGLLGSPPAKSRQASSIFSVSQLFLAETAMIVAQEPATQRPILITPPRRWDPSVNLASKLLSDTVAAPWLRTATLNQLAAQKQEHVVKSVVRPYPKAKLTGKLLGKVRALDNRVSLLQSIRTTNDLRLDRAMFGIESSRWAGSGVPEAQARLAKLARYVNKQFTGLSFGGGQANVIGVLLGGKDGTVNVSIHNGLSYAVKVGLRVTSDNELVVAKQHNSHELYRVPPRSSATVQLKVSAAQTGRANVTLRLRSKTGKLLPASLAKPLILKLNATSLGTVALVIFAAALAVFVIASAAQALRRGRPDGTDPAAVATSTEPEPPSPGANRAAPEAGGAGSAAASEERGQEQPAAPDRPDNVFGDRSDLSPAGPAPGHRPTEETR